MSDGPHLCMTAQEKRGPETVPRVIDSVTSHLALGRQGLGGFFCPEAPSFLALNVDDSDLLSISTDVYGALRTVLSNLTS
jgi:hypothetical protein